MNSTFKSWLIANFEIFVTVILAIIIIPLHAIFIGKWDLGSLVLPAFLIFIPFALAATPPNLIESILSYLVALAGCVYFIVSGPPEEFKELRWLASGFLPILIGASVIGFFLARYAYRNFDEILSHRMLYLNSSASLFEMQWKYTLDRFCNISFSIVFGIIAIAVMVAWCAVAL